MKRKYVALAIFSLIFFIGFEFSDMTLAFINLPSEYSYYVASYDRELPKNVTMIVPICYVNGEPAKIRYGNVTIVNTQYGK